MKYGNFVGQKSLPFSIEEGNKITEHFIKMLEGAFPKGFFMTPYYERNEMEHFEFMYLVFPLSCPFNGRNKYKARCRGVDAVTFFLTKNEGYLETKDKNGNRGRDYKHCPPFSYGCSLSVTGWEKAFRKRHEERIQNWSPYTYGTEIEDLDYTDQLSLLKRSISG